MKRGQMWVSVIIYTLVAIVALVLILNTGLPLLNTMRDRAVFSKVQSVMLELDSHITEIASQGEGSQASVSFEIRDGEMRFEDNQLVWEIETKSEIIAPRSSTRVGNLIIASNANVKASESPDAFELQTTIKNDTFLARFNKIGSRDNWVVYNTSQIIDYIDYNGNRMDGLFSFNLNDDVTTARGTGYTEMIPLGNQTHLGRAKVVAHMNNSFASYDLEFILNSYADFITIRVRNFEPK